MAGAVQRGCASTGTLPGPMHVRRRAAELHKNLSRSPEAALRDPLSMLDWVNLYAMAVNEENAAGGRGGCRFRTPGERQAQGCIKASGPQPGRTHRSPEHAFAPARG